MRSRRMRLAVVAAGLTLALAACGSGSTSSSSSSSASGSQTSSAAATGKKLNIWYVNVLPSYPAWGASSKLFEQKADELNYKATAVGPPKVDGAAMIQMMDQAIADGANGIITCNIDPKTFESEIKKAQAAGIVVVTIGCVDDMSDYSIGTDNKAFGEAAADIFAQKVGKNAKIGIVSTDQTTPNQVAQVNALKAKIASTYPDMKVVAWESGKGDTSIDAQKITGIIQANPDVSAIWCVEGTCPGAAQAGLSEAGKKPGDVFFLGIDDVDTTIAGIKDGWVSASINQCFFIAPPLAVDLIRRKLEGNAVAQQSWAVGTDLITKDNLPYKGCPASTLPTIP